MLATSSRTDAARHRRLGVAAPRHDGRRVCAREERVAEIRDLVGRYDAELASPLGTPEYGLAEGYQLWAQTYDAPLRLFPVEEPVVHGLLAELQRGCVLDAACGTGRHSLWLAKQGHEVIGVDASPAMLAKARAKLPGARFEQGDLAALPLPDASVDAALCALALVHVPDLHPALAELARVVRPGGRIVISDVHPFLVALGWQAQFRTADGATGSVRLNGHRPSQVDVRAASERPRLDRPRHGGAAAAAGLRRNCRPGPDPGSQHGGLGWGPARGDCPRFDAVS